MNLLCRFGWHSFPKVPSYVLKRLWRVKASDGREGWATCDECKRCGLEKFGPFIEQRKEPP